MDKYITRKIPTSCKYSNGYLSFYNNQNTECFNVYIGTGSTDPVEPNPPSPDEPELPTTQSISLNGAGFGIGNTYSNPEGGVKANYGTIDDAFVSAIANAGFKFVRVIIDIGKNNWSVGQDNKENYPDGYTGGAMDFVIASKWLAELRKLADLCRAHGLQLTICPFGWMVFWGQVKGTLNGYSPSGNSQYSWGEYYWASPNKFTKKYCKEFLSRLWTQLATAFKEYDMMSFEIVNEPLNVKSDKTNNLYKWRAYTGESFDNSVSSYNSEDWDGLNQSKNYIVSAEAGESLAEIELEAIKAIRNTGAKNLILCPTYAQAKHYNWIEFINENVIKKSGDNNCVVSIHWYSPDKICGKNVVTGAVFDSTAQDYAGDTGNYITGIASVKKAIGNRIPIAITESCICMSKTRVDDSERLKWATDINENIVRKGVPFLLFDNGSLINNIHLNQNSGEDYGVINRTTLALSDKAMVDKLVSN